METKKKKLETHDLMIGDLVISKEEIFRVRDVWWNTILHVRDLGKKVSKYLKKGEFDGIELNGSILVDNGFKRIDDDKLGIAYVLDCDDHEILIINNRISITPVHNEQRDSIALRSILPRYVHELQQLLRLFGHNDLANNFTVK